jgi:parallel beta-helix repeat protein
MSLQGGAVLELEGNRVHDSIGQGIVLDDCSGSLTGNKVEDNEERGVWLQNVSKPLALTNNELRGNERAGLGTSASTNITIKGGLITGTKSRLVRTKDGKKTDYVGDGVQVGNKSKAIRLEGVKIEGNKRVGLLIDDATVNVASCTISGGVAQFEVQNAKVSDQTYSKINVTPKQVSVPRVINCDPVPLP